MCLSIKSEDPVLSWELDTLRVSLDLFPICLMPHISRSLTSLLHGLYTVIPNPLMSLHSFRHAVFAPSPKAHSNSDTILDSLRSALRTRRQKRMRRVSQQQNPRARTHPRGQRVAIHQLPIDEALLGRLLDDARAHGVPGAHSLQRLAQAAGEAPALGDVVLVRVGQHPAAVGAVLERREQEVHVRADPAVEGVAVGAEVRRGRVRGHRRAREPRPPHRVPRRFGLVVVAEHGFARFGAHAVCCDDHVCGYLHEM